VVGTTLVVFAREPVAGRVKTRLAATIGAAAALRLHVAFVEDVCALAAGIAGRLVLAVAGDPEHPGFAGLSVERMAQGEGDLGARMDRALGLGGAVCIIGSDAPTVPRAHLADAFRLLEDAEVVLGPSTDGGYWLVGARRPAPELFCDMAWGTPAVLPETLRRLAGARAALLPFHYDVDEAGDLALLRAHLVHLPPTVAPATRRTLADLRLT
jgi:uncharacterized protein